MMVHGLNAKDIPMSILSTELLNIMVAYYNTHVKVNTNKEKIIQFETAQQTMMK